MRTLIIMRGIPGSGKSTYALKLQSSLQVEGRTCAICSADYFFSDDGEYRFDPSKLRQAHSECFSDFTELMNGKQRANMLPYDTIIVDNTNTQKWEFERYIHYSGPLDYERPAWNIRVLRCEAPLNVCQKRNIHGVPADKIQQMRDRFEDFPGEDIINTF